MPLLSVIVPVYKVEKYLSRCVDSILVQTFTDFKVILVDDGSPDNCGAICDRYQELDARVISVHKENGGASSARNFGLKYVDSEWVSFVDSDDYLEPNHFEVHMRAAIENNVELTISNYLLIIPQIKKQYAPPVSCNGIIQKENIPGALITNLISSSEFMPVWRNCYKKSIIDSLKLNFVSEREVFAEDYLFNLQYYGYISSAYIINEATYCHIIDKNSLSQGRRRGFLEMELKCTELSRKILNKNHGNKFDALIYEKYIDSLGYSLFKEGSFSSLSEIKAIIKSPNAQMILNTQGRPKGKYSLFFYLAKKNKYAMIKLFSFIYKLFEPLYRYVSYLKYRNHSK